MVRTGIPVSFTLRTLRVVGTLAPGTIYYPPADSLVTAVWIENAEVAFEARGQDGTWYPCGTFPPAPGWGIGEVACDGSNMRLINKSGTTTYGYVVLLWSD